MSKARQEKRSKIKPFIKVVNYNHLMPTRYTLELEGLKGSVTPDTFKEVSQREDAKKTVKKTLEERYTSGKNRWFFTPLRMSPRVHGSLVEEQHTAPPPILLAVARFYTELRLILCPQQAFERLLIGWAGRTVLGCIQHHSALDQTRWL